VGTTTPYSSHPPCPPVHPHARGDNGYGRGWNVRAAGSPPRAWGQLLRHHTHIKLHRFTPTRVGTTPQEIIPLGTVPVHPHARGDNFKLAFFIRCRSGSPPRAWGQRTLPVTTLTTPRFTPTRVGTTFSGNANRRELPVHPHARGDNFGV